MVARPVDEPNLDARTGDPYRQADAGRILLPGPLRLSRAWVRTRQRRDLGVVAIATVLLAAAALWTAALTRDAVRAREAWSDGVTATDAQVDGTTSARLVFAHADLGVFYTDASGHRHRHRVTRIGLGQIDDSRPPVVRHAVDDPEQFAVSWLIDGLLGELAFNLLLVALLVAGGPAALAVVRDNRRDLALVRDTLRRDPAEVVLEVLAATHNNVRDEHVTTTYDLRIPDGGRFALTLPRDEHPLFLEPGRSRVLGLRRPDDLTRAVVLREDMTPLAAPDREAERVRVRWREAQRKPGKPTLDQFIADKFSRARERRR